MTIGRIENHPAPTPSRPRKYTLFFIPRSNLADLQNFFTHLDEPDDYFVVVPAMRVDQLAWQPDRIKRADVRSLTNPDGGVWVAFSKPQQAAQFEAILDIAA